MQNAPIDKQLVRRVDNFARDLCFRTYAEKMHAPHSLYQIRLAHRTVDAFDLRVTAGLQFRHGRIGNVLRAAEP